MNAPDLPTPPESALVGIIKQHCPRCRRGPLFTHSGFSLAHFSEMPVACPVCNLNYEPEPGFYWGAMYISFGFSTGNMLIIGLLVYHLLNDPDTWVYITAVAVVSILLTTFSLRYSRTLMLYLFGGVNYDPRYATQN